MPILFGFIFPTDPINVLAVTSGPRIAYVVSVAKAGVNCGKNINETATQNNGILARGSIFLFMGKLN